MEDMSMNFYNSFSEMVTANIHYGQPTNNVYSEEERLRRIEWCNKAIEEAEQEISCLKAEFTKAHSQYRFQQYLDEQYHDDMDRRKELTIHVESLTKRREQIQKNDPDGRFADRCLAIEEKLKEFKTQLNVDFSDKPALPHSVKNNSVSNSGLSVFNNPSK